MTTAGKRASVAFVTCRAFPDISEDDSLAAQECERQGMQVQAFAWEDKAVVWENFQAIVMRSAWNYYRRSTDFTSWLHSISNTNVWNPVKNLIWNVDKSYLRELEQKGIPVVPTKWLENGPELNLKKIAEEFVAESLILKPPISADGHRTFRVPEEGIESAALLSQFRQGDIIMIQPYLEEVEKEGELSFVFIGNELSHCVRKVPQEGEFRVQERFGGKMERIEKPPKDFLELANKAIAAGATGTAVRPGSPSDLLYARVDMISRNGRPLLSELEILEPSLYFKYDEKAPTRFASALKKHL